MAKKKKKRIIKKMKKAKKVKKAAKKLKAKKKKLKKLKKAKVKIKKKVKKPVIKKKPLKKKIKKPKKAKKPILAEAPTREELEPITIQRPMPAEILKMRPEEAEKIPVSAVMRKGVIVMDSNKAVEDAAKLMSRNKIGSVIVTERGKTIGIITERDIVRRIIARGKNGAIAIKEVMTTPLRVIEQGRTVRDAVALMQKFGIKRLPVVDVQRRLVGIVTDSDITRTLPGIMDLVSELSKIQRFEAGVESIGVCGRCGMWSETLMNIGGEFLCEECREAEISGPPMGKSPLL